MTQLASQPETSRPERLFRVMFKKIKFDTHIYEGLNTIPEIDAAMGGKVLDKSRVGKPPASLLPKPLLQKARRAREGVYKVLRTVFPCDVEGTRLVPTDSGRLAEFVEKLNAAIAAFYAIRDEIVDAYDDILKYNRDYWWPRCAVYTDDGVAFDRLLYLEKQLEQQQLALTRTRPGSPAHLQAAERIETLRGQIEAKKADVERVVDRGKTEARYQQTIGHLIPEQDVLREKFRVRYTLSDPDDLAGRYEDPVLRDFYDTAARNAREQAEELARELVERPSAELAKALQRLKERLDRGEKITPESFTEAQAAIAVVLNCADAVSPQMRSLVEEVRGAVDRVLSGAAGTRKAFPRLSYTEAIREHAGTLTAAVDQAITAAERKLGQAEIMAQFGLPMRRVGRPRGDA